MNKTIQIFILNNLNFLQLRDIKVVQYINILFDGSIKNRFLKYNYTRKRPKSAPWFNMIFFLYFLTESGKLINCNWTIFCIMIDRQVLPLILMSFVGTDVSARRSLVWEKARVSGKKPKRANTIAFHIQYCRSRGLHSGRSG